MPVYTLTSTDGSTNLVAFRQTYYRTASHALEAASVNLRPRERVGVSVDATVVGFVYGSDLAIIDQIASCLRRRVKPGHETSRAPSSFLEAAGGHPISPGVHA